MKTIAYYISDYGFGHASRSIAIIRKLLDEAEVEIIVCHSFALSFIKESLNSEHIRYRNLNTDIGYFLEKESIYPDKARLFMEYKSFVEDWDQYFLQEREFLSENNIDLVISDISPLPFKASDSLGIPSVGISNFTWYSAYQDLVENEEELSLFKESYQKMTYFFSLAGSQEKWEAQSNNYGFFSREFDLQEVQRIRTLVDPEGNKNIIFLGLGMKIDVGTLENLPIWNSSDCVFIVSSNVQVNRQNVFQIPTSYLETQNYIAASDLVISKAGWGIISEAVSSNVPLLILNRPSMKEDQNTINYLKRYHLPLTIDWEDFKSYQVNPSLIHELKESMKERHNYHSNQSKSIASDIIRIIKNENI